MNKLTHTNASGKARMVNVGNKPVQHRTALAEGFIQLQPETVVLIRENQLKKGDVLTVAEIAGIQAAKRTHELIPLCHPLQLTKIEVETQLQDNGIHVTCEAQCNGQTGVEMEALTGVQVALLTVYDMCKAVDKQMVINNIKLFGKRKKNIE